MMQLLCSNVHYFFYDAETFFRNNREAGFHSVELYLGTPHIFIDGKTIDDFSNIPQLAAQFDMRIAAVHPETISFRYGLCYLNDKWNAKSLEAYKRCIDYAAGIGASRLDTNLTCGFRDRDRTYILKRCADNLKELIAYGRNLGVDIALETEEAAFQGFVTNLAQLKELDAYLGDRRLLIGVNLEAMEKAGETLDQWKEAFGQRIAYLRTADPKKLTTECFDGDVILFDAGDAYLEDPFALDRAAGKEVSRWV